MNGLSRRESILTSWLCKWTALSPRLCRVKPRPLRQRKYWICIHGHV